MAQYIYLDAPSQPSCRAYLNYLTALDASNRPGVAPGLSSRDGGQNLECMLWRVWKVTVKLSLARKVPALRANQMRCPGDHSESVQGMRIRDGPWWTDGGSWSGM